MRSIGFLIWHRGTDDDVPCYYYGPTDRSDEGIRGKDPRVRPMSLGSGDYTCVVGYGDVTYCDSTTAERLLQAAKR